MNAFLAILATLAFTAAGFGAHAPDMTFEDLNSAVQKKSAFIVDVNGDESYANGHVPGAVNFYAKNFEAGLPKDKASQIVVYCGGPACTAWQKAANRLEELGYASIKHFSGGIKGWKEAGGAVEKAGAETSKGEPLGGAM